MSFFYDERVYGCRSIRERLAGRRSKEKPLETELGNASSAQATPSAIN